MRFALLAAVAVIATPVMAQETPGTAPTDQTAPAGDASQAGAPMGAQQSDPSMPPPSSDPSMQQQQPMGDTGGGMASAPTDPNGADPAGGYQPSGTPTSGPAQPGAQVVFKPAPSPTEAFPPPPPMKKYPICKKGQYDNCMQRGGR